MDQSLDTDEVDVVVIGMGPGGEFVADGLLSHGLRVVAIESELIGGECAQWGCVPTKMMVRGANLLAEARRLRAVAGSASVTSEWSLVARRIRDEATYDWHDDRSVSSFEAQGGRFIRGSARFVGASEESLSTWQDESGAIAKFAPPPVARREVAVGAERLAPRLGVVVATGATAWTPDIAGLDELPYWTNRDVVRLEKLPRSLVILGGGAVACELGQLLARFGVAVTIIEEANRLLESEEPEAGGLLEDVFRADGIDVRTNTTVRAVTRSDDTYELDLGASGRVHADQLLVATGRRPDLRTLGVDVLGLDPASSRLETDERMRVAPGVWAVGDVTGRGSFTHVATYQARIAVADIVGDAVEGARYHAVPRVVFTDPEVGAVGLSEAHARSMGLDVRVGTAPLPIEARGWIHKVGNDGLIKVVEDRERGVLVGALSIGPSGGEVLGLLALAVHAEVPVAVLQTMLYAYPTFHRTIETALADLH